MTCFILLVLHPNPGFHSIMQQIYNNKNAMLYLTITIMQCFLYHIKNCLNRGLNNQPIKLYPTHGQFLQVERKGMENVSPEHDNTI